MRPGHADRGEVAEPPFLSRIEAPAGLVVIALGHDAARQRRRHATQGAYEPGVEAHQRKRAAIIRDDGGSAFGDPGVAIPTAFHFDQNGGAARDAAEKFLELWNPPRRVAVRE